MRDNRDRYGACLDAEMWGYPRRIDCDEVEIGAWYRYGEDVVFWFIGRGEAHGELVLHIAIRPSMQKRVYPREWFAFVRCIGMLLGYDRLRFLGEEPEKVASLLRRWGWRDDSDGLFLDLEADHG